MSINILIVDDDPIDTEALKRTLKAAEITDPLYEAKDGEEALRMLRHEEGATPVPAPVMVLLDLNMPRMNGLEFLEALRKDPDPVLRRTVVFVLTTSEDIYDRCGAYDAHISGYIVKSHKKNNFSKLAHFIKTYSQMILFP